MKILTLLLLWLGLIESSYPGNQILIEGLEPSDYIDDPFQGPQELDHSNDEKSWEEEPEFYPGNIYLGHQASFEKGFEESEIRNSLDFIEFKIRHVQELMVECIKNQFSNDLMATMRKVKDYCVGMTFQILFQNYEEGLRKLKDIITELLRIKFDDLPVEYEEEVDFFMDLIEQFIEKDLSLPQSLKISKRTSKYFVAKDHYTELVNLAQEEISAFDEVHVKIKKSRNEVAALLEEESKEQESYVEALETQASSIE
jgi:hypothetical protein